MCQHRIGLSPIRASPVTTGWNYLSLDEIGQLIGLDRTGPSQAEVLGWSAEVPSEDLLDTRVPLYL